jgi:quercetin dioxygenase-like cupin family protein
MKVFTLEDREAELLDPANFTGRGTLVRMLDVCETPKINAYTVTFQAGTRTAWHVHTGTQLLLVTAGTCRFQGEGEPVREAGAGSVVGIAPGERHWHGATPDAPATHVALNVEATTDWFEKVTDEEYAGAPGASSG